MSGDLLRFVVQSKHPPFGHRSGIFKSAYQLRRELPDSSEHTAELKELLLWFGAHLAVPKRLSPSRHPRAQPTAISWIRASAVDHVRRLRRLAAILEDAAHLTCDELRTDRPGYVVFEDNHQVVAVPFADTPR